MKLFKPLIHRKHLSAILLVAKFGLLLILLLMFMNFNSKIVQNSNDTKAIANNTNTLVRSQKDILNAISQVTVDTKTTATQQTAIIICMLQVPVTQRTTDLQQQCRKQVGAVVLPVSNGSNAKTTQNSTSSSAPSSFNISTSTPPAQSNNVQPTPVKVLGIRVCVPFTGVCVTR